MNITFLLGNGFDLQLGMETSYRSFLNWYIQQPTDDPDILKFQNYLKDKNSKWWSDAEIAMGEYLGEFTDDNIAVYFKNIRDFKLNLSYYLTFENLRYDSAKISAAIESFNEFLIKSAEDIMLRVDNLTLNYRRQFTDATIDIISFNYTDAIDMLVSASKSSTPTIDTKYGHATRIGNVYHVHGTLDSSLIMGVDNLKQLDTTTIANTTKLRRTLIKPTVNDELGRNEHTLAMQAIRSSDYMFFYGLSFGDSDRTWWLEIKTLLETRPSLQIVIFTRSSNEDIREIIPEDILDYVNDRKDEFLAKIGIAPNSKSYEDVRKRIFVIRNTERLNIGITPAKEPSAV